jgi:hypothetical protein
LVRLFNLLAQLRLIAPARFVVTHDFEPYRGGSPDFDRYLPGLLFFVVL